MTGTPCEDWIIMSTYAVGIVGAGRVGAVLGAALARAGHRIVAASGVSAASKDRIVKLLPGVPALPADEVAAAAELLIIAVPDDTLAPLVAGLADTQALRPGQIVAHTSGAHGISVLAHAALAHGANHLVTMVNEALDRLLDAAAPPANYTLSLHDALPLQTAGGL